MFLYRPEQGTTGPAGNIQETVFTPVNVVCIFVVFLNALLRPDNASNGTIVAV